ncbi:MAG: hypothetical protein K5644_10285 [Lachnospiraceae bacterium]|nr:hypothetical protein [Lachnospiraceae bacterium]
MRKKIVRKIGAVFLGITMCLSATLTFTGNMASVEAAQDYYEVYRLYNQSTGEHFYTKNVLEYEDLQKIGWIDEGFGWYGAGSGEPVYRLYNPNAEGGDHYYTLNKEEAQGLVDLGWLIDNDWAPAFYSKGDANLYVAYNPNAQSGAHNYTTNYAEQQSLLAGGWLYDEIAWKVLAVGPKYTSKVAVDCDITSDGGGEASNPGSFRWLYSDRSFDDCNVDGEIPEIDFSGDVTMSGSNDDYGMQFVIAGSQDKSGQVGLQLHYQAGSDARYGQGKIATASINFPVASNSYGAQYYSNNTTAPNISSGQTVRLQVKYYSSGVMQTYVDGVLVGQYLANINTAEAYVLHFQANTSCTVSNIKVLVSGIDKTTYGGEDPFGFNAETYDVSGSYGHDKVAHALYYPGA